MSTINEEEEFEDILQFTSEDVKKEVAFWNHSVVCYILGANPPWDVIEDYVFKVWDQFGVDRVSFMDNGVFLVRLKRPEQRDALLNSGYYLFENKPVVVKPWNSEADLVKGDMDIVPVWIRMTGIPLKFWGDCLSSIAGYGHDEHQCRKKAAQRKPKAVNKAGNLPQKPKQVWRPVPVQKVQNHTAKSPVQVTPLFTPEVFPPLAKGISSTPARQLMRMNRQDGVFGQKVVGKSGAYTFMDALNGMTTPGARKVVKWFMHNNGVGLFGLLETKLKPSGLLNKNSSLCDGWSVSTNCSWHKGGRIWVLWNPLCSEVTFLAYGAQFIHMMVVSRTDHKKFLLTMVYAFNGINERQELWNFLKKESGCCSLPWLWTGDFNAVLSPVERLGGNTTEAEMQQFQDCVSICGMEDLSATGALFTCNSTVIASALLEEIQKMIMEQPGDMELIQNEYNLSQEVRALIEARDSFLAQKAKIQWSIAGDINTDYFHHAIKKRTMLNKVMQIETKDGVLCTEGSKIQQAFLDYYEELLGKSNQTNDVNVNVVRRGSCCTDDHWALLAKPVTFEEIRSCLFSIPKDKSPGPDGYTSQFFKDAWDIIGDEIGGAIMNFFDSGKLLSQINSTVITLIPKVDRPTNVTHFRPISCCNVIYKTISKLLCNRLALVLPDIISRNQEAFVKGRSILENILICQDLVRYYSRKTVSSRSMFKLDLQKAYDTIEWGFVEQMLGALHFPEKFKGLIMSCITSTSFTLNLNGIQFGYFHGKRGLRQGDPMSPLIFTICMEYLTRILDYATHQWYFRYHPLCAGLKLNHLLFADDLMLFCKGDVRSMMLLLRAISTSSASSGLRVNASKSEVIFNGVSDAVRADIVQISGCKEGQLPLRYLGIPIQPGRLTRQDCNILLDWITAKIKGIGARKLSYAGRLTLINSVLNTLHNYWASIFLIRKCIITRIEAICRNYLWDGGAEYQRAPLVAWHTADRLWVLWIDHVYMKGGDWNSYTPPTDVNWNWRNICKVKSRMAAEFQNGVWVHDPKGILFASILVSCWLQGTHPPVQWYEDVWDSWCVPKHAFIGWLIKREALNTRLKLKHIGVCTTDSCVLCEGGPESHDHLFQDCPYSVRVIGFIEDWLQRKLLSPGLHYTMQQRRIGRVALLACWYHLWQERNRCRLELNLHTPGCVGEAIKKLVTVRLRGCNIIPARRSEKDWLQRIGVIIS
ncbi:uncharacterized protein LOC141613691 [Silene latifolia]|uniref:uncharacterized protein LOC141613691 n=1 Tax=Silene latifolia TaxID=37657 RepID=UPI003D76D78A